MTSRHPTCAAALVVTLVSLGPAVPSAAHGPGRGWIPHRLGADVFPGNGRIGFGAVARLRAAGRPATDAFLSVGFASVQARVTVR